MPRREIIHFRAACGPLTREPMSSIRSKQDFFCSLRRKMVPAGQHFAHAPAPVRNQSLQEFGNQIPDHPRTIRSCRANVVNRSNFANCHFRSARHQRWIDCLPSDTVLRLQQRKGTGATLPTAIRMSSTTPLASLPNAAMHTFEIACAFRAPTFRAYEVYPVSPLVTQTARINSSTARRVFL